MSKLVKEMIIADYKRRFGAIDSALLIDIRGMDANENNALRLDLGGRVVELHYFGTGNTPGDTVVYVPEAKVAWTGNLVLGEGIIPWAIEGNTPAYLRTIARFAASLDVETIVPGHGVMTSRVTLDTYRRYLSGHINAVQGAIRSGQTLEQTLAGMPLGESYLPPADSPLALVRPFAKGFHLWNVKKTYLELNGK